MIAQYNLEGSIFKPAGTGGSVKPVTAVTWVDLLQPDANEIAQLDEWFGLNLPTLDQMREIEVSSRLYEENGVAYMTFVYVSNSLGDCPETTPFTFIVKDNLLVTIR